MKSCSIAPRRLVWLSTLLAVVLTCPVSADDDDDVAFYQKKGFVVVGETLPGGYLFEGCEVGEEILLDNGQTFVCAESILPTDFDPLPDVFILKHSMTGEIKVAFGTHSFEGIRRTAVKGTLQGAATAEPTPAPRPARAPLGAAVPAPVPEPKVSPPPGPKPLPPAFGSPANATPPSQVKLIAPIMGTWRTSAAVSGAQVDVVAMLDADGNFNRFERWSFGLTVQVWGTYVASPITPTQVQLSQRPTGWEPKEWCIRGDVCTALSYPEGATQFTFLDADTIRDDNTKAVYKRE